MLGVRVMVMVKFRTMASVSFRTRDRTWDKPGLPVWLGFKVRICVRASAMVKVRVSVMVVLR